MIIHCYLYYTCFILAIIHSPVDQMINSNI